ncbi:MAG: alpha/beta fold hydrolase [Rhodoferax sp.]|uniref:alpha/beta hydrolase n=1 Tax=Rhodoferax sp. TaxID=50421 RepID=UPI00301A108C
MTNFKRGGRFLRWLWVFSLISTSGCAWLDAHQRQIIYRPTTGAPTEVVGRHPGDQRFFLTVPSTTPTRDTTAAPPETQRIELWWLHHADPQAPTLLYLHGTFRTVFENLHKIEALRSAGFNVLAVDYRGWGLSTPLIPSEQTILQDADLAWAELQRREPRAAQRVIYGHSMGSGVAVDLASRLRSPTDYGALILESAFTSFSDVAREAGYLTRFLDLFNNERFASIDKIARVNAPLLMLHGALDSTIPIRLGQQLFVAANPPKHWLTIEGGAHSDLNQVDQAQYQATLQRFMHDYVARQQAP